MSELEIPVETQKKIEQSKFLYSRNRYIFDFAFETWYEKLKDFTAKTKIIPLSMKQIQSLYNYCDDIYCNQKKKCSKEDEEEILKLLKIEITKSINEFNGKVFVKLSTRSPKDAFSGKIMQDAWISEIGKMEKQTPNEDVIAFSNAIRKLLLVTNGEEVITMFGKSSRIREDLMKALEFPNAFKLSIIVREWNEMNASMEFRGFVFNQKLTAISQYCYLTFFANLINQKDEIEKKILNFFEKIQPLIPQKNYIIDFCILKDGRVQMIELNPFFNDTSACLFSWKMDQKILKGEEKFEFRILSKPIEDPYCALSLEWRKFIENYRNEDPYKDYIKYKVFEKKKRFFLI